MANELDVYGGNDLQPYQPGTDLAPADSWGRTDVDYLDDRFERGFGQLDPQVEANVAAIAEVFTNDMAGLGYVQRDIDKIIGWFKQSLVNPVTRMPRKAHAYETWQFSNDPAFQAFCNWAATQRFPQSLIQSVAYWLQQLDDFQHGAGRFAGVHKPASSDPTDSLSDSDYERVVQINAQAAARTDGILRDKFGTSYHGAMKVIRDYWDKLSTAEQEHLSQYSTGWVKATNTPEILLGLYDQAIGAGSIPKDSVGIAREIASYEELMRSDRRRWLASDDLQQRYRHLLMLRDGGR